MRMPLVVDEGLQLCVLAALASVVLALLLMQRSSAVVLPIDDWRCASRREEKIAETLPQGGVAFRSVYACDQWVRR